ncbi:transposase domain protein [Haemophilus parahaemolyticus HK385]|uniref:Transposase domain protein n=1 Tax=Haemophilus parahaemolyticus HK385 TaxID=1095744 RepID=A0ABP2P263_HAEPH|nr:transposase domain protein [Haemophilus parahaemolyticus HK385]
MIGYQNILMENGIQQSMNCLDNSAMERCFGRLTECYYGK